MKYLLESASACARRSLALVDVCAVCERGERGAGGGAQHHEHPGYERARNPIDGRAASRHASETTAGASATAPRGPRSPRSERFGSVHEVPVEPPPSRWELPAPAQMPEGAEIAGVGADLAPGTLLAAYRQGLFPDALQARGPLGLGSAGMVVARSARDRARSTGLHVSRSLRRSQRRFEIRVDTAFEDVMRGCADPRRPHGWIDKKFIAAYTELHRARLGAQRRDVAGRRPWPDRSSSAVSTASPIGGLFAAESKFHRVTDASKVAVVALVDLLRDGGGPLLDVQWTTPHLASLGAVDVPRARYLELVAERGANSPGVDVPRSWTAR